MWNVKRRGKKTKESAVQKCGTRTAWPSSYSHNINGSWRFFFSSRLVLCCLLCAKLDLLNVERLVSLVRLFPSIWCSSSVHKVCTRPQSEKLSRVYVYEYDDDDGGSNENRRQRRKWFFREKRGWTVMLSAVEYVEINSLFYVIMFKLTDVDMFQHCIHHTNNTMHCRLMNMGI